MEIASRIKIKRIGFKRIDFSDHSSLPVNPNSGTSSRTCKKRKQEEEGRSDVMSKRQNIMGLRVGETKNKSRVVTKSVTLSRICLHHQTETKPKVITKPVDKEVVKNQSCSLKDLIAKAKNKVEEKRQLDGRREYYARLRLEARLAMNRVVQTVVVADDHLKYHCELEQLGCGFIHDQVTCLTKFVERTQ